jgi:hypothetical protein
MSATTCNHVKSIAPSVTISDAAALAKALKHGELKEVKHAQANA